MFEILCLVADSRFGAGRSRPAHAQQTS
jgi:hypothetical protein